MGRSSPPVGGAATSLPPSPFVHALSGAVGAVAAMALLYPLDQVRAILQVDDELARECAAPGGAGVLGALSRIIQRRGRAGLWLGMGPVLITMGLSNFVYFYCFNGMKAALLARRRLLEARGLRSAAAAAAKDTAAAARASSARVVSSALLETAAAKTSSGAPGVHRGGQGGGLTPLESVVASTIAGVLNVLATTPLWVSNLRIKAGNGTGGLFPTLLAIGRHEGLAGLWSGAAPSLVLVSNPIIQFVVYEALKQIAGRRHDLRRQFQPHGGAAKALVPPHAPSSAVGGGGGGGTPGVGLRSHEAFLLGATAKAAATLVTYPLQLAQAKLRAGRARGGEGRGGQQDCPYPAVTERTWRSSVGWQVLTCWSGTVNILTKIYRQNGVRGMYQGMRAKLLHTVLTSALLFLGYERILEMIATFMAAMGEEKPSSSSSLSISGSRRATTAAAAPSRLSKPKRLSAAVS